MSETKRVISKHCPKCSKVTTYVCGECVLKILEKHKFKDEYEHYNNGPVTVMDNIGIEAIKEIKKEMGGE